MVYTTFKRPTSSWLSLVPLTWSLPPSPPLCRWSPPLRWPASPGGCSVSTGRVAARPGGTASAWNPWLAVSWPFCPWCAAASGMRWIPIWQGGPPGGTSQRVRQNWIEIKCKSFNNPQGKRFRTWKGTYSIGTLVHDTMLTSSHRMPFKPAIFFGGCVYTQVFLGVRGDTVRWPRIVDCGFLPNLFIHQPRICKDGFISIVYAVCSTGCG